MNRRKFILSSAGAFTFPALAGAAELQRSSSAGNEPSTLDVQFDQTPGMFRALHGINKGPLTGGGLIDLTDAHHALRIPWTRLHDCHFPNPDVVDIHAVFPRADADPSLESSYDFARTDRYLEGIRATGAGIVYRLGESIEHEPVKKWVHPPRDPARWAQICIGIIQHYNEGWAGGFRHGIPYWEIWNEPENRPVMWTGTDEEFFALYRTTSRAIKNRFPALKVGGPSIGGTGSVANGGFQPSPFLKAFLDHCRRESWPLDFFSWHCYTNDVLELSTRSRGIRALLDSQGLTKSESHLNEWNYLPDNSWRPLSPKTPALERQRAFEQMSGPHGAAFIVAALIELQDAPVDMANLFHGETGAFGLFTEQGVPTSNYDAVRAFAQLLQTPRRAAIHGTKRTGCFAAAGMNPEATSANVLIANCGLAAQAIQLNVRGLAWNSGHGEVQRLDLTQPFRTISRTSFQNGLGQLLVVAPAPSVVLVTLSQRGRATREKGQ